MRAIVQTKYGPPEVLQIKELEKPSPKPNEALIKVRATLITATNCIFREGNQLAARLYTGITRPKQRIPGFELAGDIEEIGQNVTRFAVGDPVFGITESQGAHAEYLTMQEDGVLEKKPVTMSYEEAAAVCDGALTALPFLRDEAKIQEGQRVLVNGASGAIGTFAVQLAKYFGADVTGVCSTRNLELVRSLGADHVIDYTQSDFTARQGSYDVIFDTIGKSSFSRCKHALAPRGIYLTTSITLPITFHMLWTATGRGKRAIFAATGLRPARDRAADLRFLKKLIEVERLKPVIDRRYSLDEVTEAHRYAQTGHKKGNLVLSPAAGSPS